MKNAIFPLVIIDKYLNIIMNAIELFNFLKKIM